jgi:hypothetical protein
VIDYQVHFVFAAGLDPVERRPEARRLRRLSQLTGRAPQTIARRDP